MGGTDSRLPRRLRRLVLAAALVAGIVAAQSGVAAASVPSIPAKGTGYKTPFR